VLRHEMNVSDAYMSWILLSPCPVRTPLVNPGYLNPAHPHEMETGYYEPVSFYHKTASRLLSG
jgi:hypothetical protein